MIRNCKNRTIQDIELIVLFIMVPMERNTKEVQEICAHTEDLENHPATGLDTMATSRMSPAKDLEP